jgi:post-segregation antitoxin (ccd killing protein)
MPRKYTRRPPVTPPDPAAQLDLPRNLSAPGTFERVNLRVKSALLAEARRYDVNLSEVLNAALRKHVCAVRRDRWLAAHYPAIATYNRRVEADGLLSDALWDD